MGIDVTSFYIYRWRYYLGYGLIGLLLIGLLVFAGLFIPGGISEAEKSAVIISASARLSDLSTLTITNLPFHLLQHASITIFGVSDFSIKLPSIILAFISAVGLVLLLRQWFKPNIAVLTAIIAISTGQFIFIAQNGTPAILYVLWSVWLILLGTLITKNARWKSVWIMLFFIIVALSTYTPLSLYVLLAVGLTCLLHPHLRHTIKRLPKLYLILGSALAIIILAPLVIGIAKTSVLATTLLGVPAVWPDFIANVNLLANQYFGFWKHSSTGLMTPVFGLGTMIIIAIGAYKLFKTRETTQSYLIIIWLVFLIPVIVINPQFSSITFLPLILLIAMGLTSLLVYWYRLFPRNPYARIAGLVPLIVMIGVLVLSGLERYIDGYQYDPSTVANFSKDLSLIPKDTKQLVVVQSEYPFYSVMSQHNKNLSVVMQSEATEFVTTQAASRTISGYRIDKIITSSTADNADRFYVYKKNTN